MDMLKGEQIAEARLTDWRKLAQGLHARYVVDDFGAGARFVAAVGKAGDELGHHPRVSIGDGYVDLKLVTDDAIYRDDEGTEYVIEWVTQQDVDLARRITEIADDHQVDADPASVSDIELGLDTAHSATIAPVWAVLLTGSAEAQGRGTPSDEIRDATARVPNLWFGDADEHETPRQRFHIEIYVAPEVAEQRIAAAVAAGGTIVDDSNAPSLTVIADQDGNKGIVCVDVSAAKKGEVKNPLSPAGSGSWAWMDLNHRPLPYQGETADSATCWNRRVHRPSTAQICRTRWSRLPLGGAATQLPAHSATIAPVWAILLTGSAEAQGRGTPSDEIRDATARVPNLWFGDADEHETPRQRFHIEVYVAPEVAEQRIAAAVAAGGIVVDDSNAPSLTVIADQDGNQGIVCVDVSAAKK